MASVAKIAKLLNPVSELGDNTNIVQVKTDNEQFPISARDIWKKLNSKRDFSHWINNHIETNELVENIDYRFSTLNVENPRGGRPEKEYYLNMFSTGVIIGSTRTKEAVLARKKFAKMALTSQENQNKKVQKLQLENLKLKQKKKRQLLTDCMSKCIEDLPLSPEQANNITEEYGDIEFIYIKSRRAILTEQGICNGGKQKKGKSPTFDKEHIQQVITNYMYGLN